MDYFKSDCKTADILAFQSVGGIKSLLVLVLAILAALFSIPALGIILLPKIGMWFMPAELALWTLIHFVACSFEDYRGFIWTYGKGRSPKQLFFQGLLCTAILVVFAASMNFFRG